MLTKNTPLTTFFVTEKRIAEKVVRDKNKRYESK